LVFSCFTFDPSLFKSTISWHFLAVVKHPSNSNMSIRLVLLHLLALAAWAHPHDGRDQISGPDSLHKRYNHRISKLSAMKVDAGLLYPRRPACPDPNTPFLCGDFADQGMLHYRNCQLRVGLQCCTDSAHCCPDITCAPSGFCTEGSDQCCPDESCAPSGFECCGGGNSCDPTDNPNCCGNS
jgi:hypothetical protein